jgi:glycosyltransferase involved in cell wall biosynthesis
MRILHVSPSYYPATIFGGPIFSTMGLCDSLALLEDIELRVLTTDTAGPKAADRIEPAGFPVIFPTGYAVYYSRKTFGTALSIEMFRYLFAMARWADVVHLTGVYSPSTIPTLFICRLLGKPIVWSPRGALQRWSQCSRPLLKLLWEKLCNVLVVPGQCVLHVTSDAEATACEARIPKAATALIPNGIISPSFISERVWFPDGHLRVLYLGRLHPVKGIENLLGALAAADLADVQLTICGEGEPSYTACLIRRVHDLGLVDRVVFCGHVENEAKTSAFAQTDVCVVPSYTENFGMVVAEALAHGVPVIVSKGAPWLEVETRGCGLWVENTNDSLAAALREIRKCDLAEMGSRGRRWMERDFSWNRVAEEMHTLYRKLIAGTNK